MPDVIRRLFTLASVLAFALLFIVRFFGDGDPRYSIIGITFILHPENRMAIRLSSGTTWAFNYSALYFPVTGCFLLAAVWNWTTWRRKRPTLKLPLAVALSGAVTMAFGLLSIGFPNQRAIYLGLVFSGVAFAFASGLLWLRFVTAPPRPRRDSHRRCARCQYDLTGNVSGTCPECGTTVAQSVE